MTISDVLNYYETLSYDDSGNVINQYDSRTSYFKKSFQWDGRQLTNVGSYCNSFSYKYNDQGIRTQKTQNTCSGSITTNYVLDDDEVLVETSSNGNTIYYTYDVDGSLLSMNYNGSEYFYITNLQGDVIELVDISGITVATYKYDAWGNTISKTGSMADINPYRYRGYRLDTETGYYYLQSRYYNPQIGRFISADGILGEVSNLVTQNMYAYAGNNPVMNIDPDGYLWNGLTVMYNNWSDTLLRVIDCLTPDTISMGLFLSGYFPIFSHFGFGGSVGGSISFMISLDKKGNIGIQHTSAIGVGTPSVGVGFSVMRSNAPTIFDLNGYGGTIGASFGSGPLFAGADLTVMSGDQHYFAETRYGGIGVKIPLPGVIHTAVSGTGTFWSINLYDYIGTRRRERNEMQ